MKRNHGFTIIELMLTLAVAAVALTIAVPSWQAFIANNRITSQVNTLTSSLLLARSEAIKQNRPIVVCPSSDGLQCSDTAWHDGWIVFANRSLDGAGRDVDDDGSGDPCDWAREVAAGGASVEDASSFDCIIATQPALRGDVTLASENTMDSFIEFTGAGSMRRENGTTGPGLFVFCDDRGAGHAAGVQISATGRPALAENQLDGSALACSF